MIVDGGAHLDLLDLDDLLLLAGLGGLFLLFVFVFAKVHQLADRRHLVGRYLDDIEPFFLTQGERLIEADIAVFVAVVADQENRLGADFLVDARTAFGRGFLVLLWPSGYYDSLLWLCRASSRCAGSVRPKRNDCSIMDAGRAFRGTPDMALTGF
jgi:hypothetical protein